MIKVFSESKREDLINEFSEESLFCVLNDVLDITDGIKNKKTSKVENWVDAKELVSKILRSKNPKIMASTVIKQFIEKCDSFDSSFRDSFSIYESSCLENLDYIQSTVEKNAVLRPATAMLYYMSLFDKKRHDIYEGLIEPIASKLVTFSSNSYQSYANKWFDIIDKAVESGDLVYDYDYGKDGSLAEAMPDLAAENEMLKAKVAELTEELEELRNPDTTALLQTGQGENTKITKVTARKCGEYVKEIPGFNQIKKQDWCKLLSNITGMSADSFKNYL